MTNTASIIWGIIGAMHSEIDLLKEQMVIESTQEISGLTYYVGSLEKERVILVCCSIGKVNAALCTQTLIQVFHANRIINTGVAGALSSELNIFDVVISDTLTYHDADLGIFKTNPPYCTEFPASPQLIDLAATACGAVEDQSFQCQIGKIVSGDVFVADASVKKRIIECFRPLCVEMEGAAVAHVAYANQVPFVVIRSMSDKADDDAEMNFDEFVVVAAQHSAQIILAMLKYAKAKKV